MESCKILNGGMEIDSGHLLLTLSSPVRKKGVSNETGGDRFEAKAAFRCGNPCLRMLWVLRLMGVPGEHVDS